MGKKHEMKSASAKLKKLAIAVPTYNRCEDIDFFIETTSFLVNHDTVDLHIFDSSEDDKTKKVVDRINDHREQYVKYHNISHHIHPNEKFYDIYRDLSDKYEYIWVIHDHTVFTEEALDFICDNLERKADFYYLKMHCPASLISCDVIEEKDREKFLYDSAWFLGKIGASILRSESFLSGIDWEYYKKKYLTKELINFSQLGLYFERLAEMNIPTMYTMEFPRNCFTDTRMYKPLPWKEDVIRICTQCWAEVIRSLPDSYRNKERVIGTIDEHLITKYNLLELKEKGLYGFGKYLKYRKWLREAFPHMRAKAFVIAAAPAWVSRKIYLGGMIERLNIAISLGTPVFIYGAGRHGYECAETMSHYGIRYEGFVVSKMEGNPDRINGVLVKTLDDIIAQNKKTVFLLAVMDIYKSEITDSIIKKTPAGIEIEIINY